MTRADRARSPDLVRDPGPRVFARIPDQSLATKGSAAEAALKAAGTAHLAGKTAIDTCNPIADAPPVNGVLQYFTSQNESLMERLQQAAPDVS